MALQATGEDTGSGMEPMMVSGSETKLGLARVAVERGVDAAATDSLPGVARGLRLARAKQLVVKPELERAE